MKYLHLYFIKNAQVNVLLAFTQVIIAHLAKEKIEFAPTCICKTGTL